MKEGQKTGHKGWSQENTRAARGQTERKRPRGAGENKEKREDEERRWSENGKIGEN